MRYYRLLLTCCLITVMTGCKLSVMVNQGGSIDSASGLRDCGQERICTIDITSPTFTDSFTAVAEPGFEFVRWQAGDGFFCGGSTAPSCVIALAGNPVDVIAVSTFETIYIMPVFRNVGIDTDGDGTRNELDTDDDNDGTPDIDDPCPLDPDPGCGLNDVGGIIALDTTWFAADGPVHFLSTVQIANGVTLTIEAGVEIIGQGNELELFGGTVSFEGDAGNRVTVRDLENSGTGTIVGVSFMNLYNVDFSGVTDTQTQHVTLVDSQLSTTATVINDIHITNSNVSFPEAETITNAYSEASFFRGYASAVTNLHLNGGQIRMELCSSVRDSFIENRGLVLMIVSNSFDSCDSTIENNVFQDGVLRGESSALSIPNVLLVRNNVFSDYTTEVVEGGSLFNGLMQLQLNSFLESGVPTVKTDDTRGFVAKNNFWGTTNTAIIDNMIYDANDDLNLEDIVAYLPILNEPDPGTPMAP